LAGLERGSEVRILYRVGAENSSGHAEQAFRAT
jgi:hypothetical protein